MDEGRGGGPGDGLLAELRTGIGRGEIVLHYQSLVDASNGRLHGVEALARWQHPTRGLLPPAAFIPQAEESDVIFALTEHVLREAIAQAARWARQGSPVPISVNISARSLAHDDLVETVADLLHEHRLPGVLLTVEVTESAVIGQPVAAAERLTALRALGVRVSIDDFGTGYTSLALLTQLPVDELKVDRTFIGTMTESPVHAAIVRTIAELAGRLALTIVGEGVEDEETAGALRGLGFDLLQGYHFGRPSPADTVTPPSDPVPVAVPAAAREKPAHLDDVVLLAARLCGAPGATLSLTVAGGPRVVATHGESGGTLLETPVRTADGRTLGVLTVADTRRPAPDHRTALEALARLAATHLEPAEA